MSDNKFISRLKGTETTKSVVEIKNDKLIAPLANVPHSTDVVGGIIDDKDTSVVVAKSAQNWKLNGSSLAVASTLSGDGNDYTGEYNVSGAGLWVDAVYTFPTTGDPKRPVAEIFNASTKWVLKLCGKNLLSDASNTIDFTLLVKIGTSNITTKTFKVAEGANAFCRKFVIDFSESEQQVIKAQGGAKLTVQLLCADSSASATIYNGMTVLSALQRRVDADAVANNHANLNDFMNSNIIPDEYFSNAEFIDEVADGEEAYAVFERDGDVVELSGWTPKAEVARKEEIIVKSDTIPTASADLVGTIYQYTGVTTNPYEHGYIYECVETTPGVYGWQRIDVQPGGSRGRFLSLWNCVTGLAESNPPISPYEYKTGDYFIVSAISTATPAVNYKPDGSSYTTGVASTTVETNEVAVDDTYFFDGTTWKLQSNSNKTVTYANIAGDIYDSVSAATALNAKQDTLVNQTNIKSVNGNSLLGAGNLELSTYLTYPAGWTTNSTTKAFCDAIAADSNAVAGKAYLGEVTINDLPAGIGNGEIVAEIMDGTTAANKVIKLTLTSGNVSPYMWVYTYWNGGSNTSGWQHLGGDFLPDQTGNSGKLLTTNGTSASWTGIKTINSGSLLGSGNIDVLVNEATPASSLGIGYTTINTTYTDSINIGNGAQVGANNAIALGAFASAEGQDSIAIYSSTGTAHRARTTHTGNIAIGYNALAINAAYTIAIGYNAYAQGTNSIQLGTGNIALKNTFQVWTYPMLNKTSGLIPSARLADQTSATQGQVLTLDANLDAEWTTISTMTGATAGDAGTSGLVPAPAAGDQTKFLQGDGTWANPTAATAWGNITGTLSDQTDLQNAMADKSDKDFSNTDMIDYVVAQQDPAAGNNYTWYRKYKSGWVEQGGCNVSSSGMLAVNLPIVMADTNYTATGGIIYSGTGSGTVGFQFIKTTTQLKMGARWNGAYNNGLLVDWQVSGMAA